MQLVGTADVSPRRTILDADIRGAGNNLLRNPLFEPLSPTESVELWLGCAATASESPEGTD
jgi:hypothetical protein